MERETISLEWKDFRDSSNVILLPNEALQEAELPLFIAEYIWRYNNWTDPEV
jgi:hypothetical protein